MICVALFVFSLSGNCVVFRRICCQIIEPFIVRCIISSEVGAIWNRSREVYPWYCIGFVHPGWCTRVARLTLYVSVHKQAYGLLPLHVFESSFMWPAGWRQGFDIASWGWSWLEFTDASVGLPAPQPRGGLAPLSTPPLFRAGGCALILYNFESKMQRLVFTCIFTAATVETCCPHINSSLFFRISYFSGGGFCCALVPGTLTPDLPTTWIVWRLLFFSCLTVCDHRILYL